LKLQITIEGKTYAAEVEVLEDDTTEELGENAADPATTPQAPAPGAYTPSRATDTRSADDKVYRSPLTGLVIKVNVEHGQAVQAGDVLLVLEAMKMETSVTAHHAGRVKSVRVQASDPVKLHQELVELE
jgi:methylmalonyl-CoA carboxyltransferase 1.3S subunit